MVRTNKILVIRPKESGGVADRSAASYICTYASGPISIEVTYLLGISSVPLKLEHLFYWYKMGSPFMGTRSRSNGKKRLLFLRE